MDPRTFTRITREAPFHDAGHGFDVFGLHPPTVASVVSMSSPLYERYFRVESDGIAHVPGSGPTIIVANHGGTLPVDAAMLCLDLLRKTSPPRLPRPISDRFVPKLPIISTLFARFGAVAGTAVNVRRLLADGELLVIWPEGVSGMAKRFRDRYQLQRWNVGFAEHAIRHGATVIPTAVIGPEESWPLAAKLRTHAFGAPYLPVPAVPLPLPAHYRIQYGPPMKFVTAAGDADNPEIVRTAADHVRHAVQQLLEDARDARRGIFR
jgi:1-acyl-sn-glycerol-3-phosphate acyltransferase